MTQSAITVPVISQLVSEGRELLASVVDSERNAQVRRMEMGRFLLKARALLPKRGSREDGWGSFLEAIELDETTAWRYIKLAEATLNLTEKDSALIPTYADLGLDRREGAQPDPDAPPPTDADAPPSEGAPVIEINEQPPPVVVPPANRDAWCTPDLLAAALPHVDVDPCSNPYSSIRADTTYMLENGQDGLLLPWFGLLYVNGPFSKLLPWAERLASELHEKRSKRTVKGAGFLVNADSSTAWWKVLTRHLPIRLDFDDRIEFKPPPGVEPSKNDRAQSLLMDEAFWKKCNRKALLEMGTLWERRAR